MPRATKKQALAERQDASTPALFDERDFPVRQDLVERIREQRYLHTGARLLDDDAKALRMVELLCAGWGIERIAQDMHVSPHSVRAAKKELRRQGKLAGWKEKVVGIWEDMIEAGSEQLRDAMEKGLLPASQIAFPVGLFVDKRALAMGEATSINLNATTELKPENLSVQRLNDFFAKLPLEGESMGKPAIPVETAPIPVVATAFAAAATLPVATEPDRPTEPATAPVAEPPRAAAERPDGPGQGAGGSEPEGDGVEISMRLPEGT